MFERDLKECRESFCGRGKGKSFQAEGPKTEKAREPTVESLVQGIWRLRVSGAERRVREVSLRGSSLSLNPVQRAELYFCVRDSLFINILPVFVVVVYCTYGAIGLLHLLSKPMIYQSVPSDGSENAEKK